MIKRIIAIALIVCCLTGCQTTTRYYGGDLTVELPANEKLEEITWKEESLWYLTRPMRDDEVAEIHTFREKAEWGVFEGTVTVIEKKEE